MVGIGAESMEVDYTMETSGHHILVMALMRGYNPVEPMHRVRFIIEVVGMGGLAGELMEAKTHTKLTTCCAQEW